MFTVRAILSIGMLIWFVPSVLFLYVDWHLWEYNHIINIEQIKKFDELVAQSYNIFWSVILCVSFHQTNVVLKIFFKIGGLSNTNLKPKQKWNWKKQNMAVTLFILVFKNWLVSIVNKEKSYILTSQKKTEKKPFSNCQKLYNDVVEFLQTVSHVAKRDGYDLNLGCRLLSICANYRDKFSPNYAGKFVLHIFII